MLKYKLKSVNFHQIFVSWLHCNSYFGSFAVWVRGYGKNNYPYIISSQINVQRNNSDPFRGSGKFMQFKFFSESFKCKG